MKILIIKETSIKIIAKEDLKKDDKIYLLKSGGARKVKSIYMSPVFVMLKDCKRGEEVVEARYDNDLRHLIN